MSGPSAQQLTLQDEQMAFYQEGMQHSATTFAEQQGLLDQMKAVYDPILAKGPNQRGFSDAERGDLNAQIVEGTARNYSRAATAVNSRLAAESGDNPLESGQSEQLRAEVAASSAGEQSREESQVVEADYAQGFKEFEGATSALATASGELNPVAYENAATGAGSAAETTAKDINTEENSWEAPVLGAVGAIAGGVATGGMTNLGNGKGFFGG